MKNLYNYTRIYEKNRNNDRTINIGNAGSFNEIIYTNCDPPEEEMIGDVKFESFHTIYSPTGQKNFTAFLSDKAPEILLIVWRDFPFIPQIEEGGDTMLQILHDNKNVKHLIIDNTYVKSGWMDDSHVLRYLENAWFPGLIELELKGFCHLQAKSFLGEKSFNEFGKFMSKNFEETAKKLKKRAFTYIPIETSEMAQNGSIDHDFRKFAFKKSYEILKSL